MKKVPGRNGGTLKTFEKGETSNPNGRPVGTKNRATILKYWLGTPVTIKNPETGEIVKCTLEDKVNLALMQKALKGDIGAIKEIQDTLYGKMKEVHEIIEIEENISDEELLKRARKIIDKG
jgi:Family of unknown function (DUF5681)